MRKCAILLAVAGLAGLSAPAHADWEQTRWGDPIETVMATVGEGIAAKPGDEGDQVFGQDQVAERTGEFHGVSVRYQFYVSPRSRGLSLVRATPLNEAQDCAAFGAAARAELGKPRRTKRESLTQIDIHRSEWASRQANLAILLSEFSGGLFPEPSCLLIWQPYGNGKPGARN